MQRAALRKHSRGIFRDLPELPFDRKVRNFVAIERKVLGFFSPSSVESHLLLEVRVSRSDSDVDPTAKYECRLNVRDLAIAP